MTLKKILVAMVIGTALVADGYLDWQGGVYIIQTGGVPAWKIFAGLGVGVGLAYVFHKPLYWLIDTILSAFERETS